MKQKPTITIHYGASHDDIAVDGHVFRRGSFSRSDQTSMRRIVVGALDRIGYFTAKGTKR